MGLVKVSRGTTPALGRDLQAVHIHDRLRRGLGFQGGNPVSVMSDELVPVVIVDDVTRYPNKASGIRTTICGLQGAASINNSYISVYNPAESRTRIVIDRLWSGEAFSTRWISKVQGTSGIGIVNAFYLPRDEGVTTAVTYGGVAVFRYEDNGTAPSFVNGFLSLLTGGSAGSAVDPIDIGVSLGPNERFIYAAAGAGQTSVAVQVTEFDPAP
jgi:hypothetical protein